METKFRESIDKAVHNPNLTGALGRFSEAYRISRAKAYEGTTSKRCAHKLPNENPTRPRISMNLPTSSPETPKRVGPKYFVPTILPRCASTS